MKSKATSPKPQGKIIDVPVTIAELHKGLDMILEAGGPVAKAIGDIVGNALFVIKTRNERRQISFAEAIWELLDESPSPEPDSTEPADGGTIFTKDRLKELYEIWNFVGGICGTLKESEKLDAAYHLIKPLNDRFCDFMEDIPIVCKGS